MVKCHIRNQEWGKVETEIGVAAAESPAYAEWWYYSLGKRYLRFQCFARGISAFGKAIELCGSASQTGILSDKEKKDAEQVIMDPRKDLVQLFIQAHDWATAVKKIEEFSKEYPKEAAFWHECMGAVYKGQKKYPEAIVELKQAMGTHNSFPTRNLLRYNKRLYQQHPRAR